MNLSPSIALVQKSLRMTRSEMFKLFDITLWPLTFFLSVTLLASFMTKDPRMIAVVTLGTIGWRAIYHFSNEVLDLFRTDFWNMCIDHLMVTPVNTWDFVLGGSVIAIVKFTIVTGLVFFLAQFFFALPPIDPIAVLGAMAILAVFGIEIGVIFLGIQFYYGENAFAASFAVSDVIAVLSGVYYPLSFLPGFLQPLSMVLPSTHGFSLIKSSYGFEAFHPELAVITLVLWAAIAYAVNRFLYEKARKAGKLLQLK